MGREIRMVPPNWQHPERTNEYGRHGPQPMHDETFAEAAQRWKDAFAAWERGERPSYCDAENRAVEFWEWDGDPPDRKYYRPWQDEEATWFQLWETVSEGTPVSPPFATKEELADYLAANGDFWDQQRAAEGRFGFQKGAPSGWGIERAKAFVSAGHAVSFMVSGGALLESKDIPAAIAKAKGA